MQAGSLRSISYAANAGWNCLRSGKSFVSGKSGAAGTPAYLWNLCFSSLEMIQTRRCATIPPMSQSEKIQSLQADLARIVELLDQPRMARRKKFPHWRRESKLLEALAGALLRLCADGRVDPGWFDILRKSVESLGLDVVGSQGQRKKQQPRRPDRGVAIQEVLEFYPEFLATERRAAEESEGQVANREGRDPEPIKALPVFEARKHIVERIASRDVLLLSGETGSGKSLLSPLFALEAGFRLNHGRRFR